MRVLAVLVLSAAGLVTACGDPDLAGSSAPRATDTLSTIVSSTPPATDHAGASIAPGASVDEPAREPVPVTTAAWLVTEPPPPGIDTTAPSGATQPTSVPSSAPSRCVDASMRWAPPLPSDAWQQFVLEAAPTGACGVTTLLMMSLVIPGTADAPGTLVTIVAQPTELAMAQPGTPIEIDGRPATLQASVSADGRPATTIIARFGDVVIDAHGFVDEPTLRRIVASIRQVDDAAWAELVASVDRG
jgi:hypothetical protein